MRNHWELFESVRGWNLASAALDKAWEEAKLLAPEKPSRERAKLAREYVRKVMAKYTKYGATDTEPDSYLAWLVDKHFNVDLGRWGD